MEPSGARCTKVPPPEAPCSAGSAVPVSVRVSVSPTNPDGAVAVETDRPPTSAAPPATFTLSKRTTCSDASPAMPGVTVVHTAAATRQARTSEYLRPFMTPLSFMIASAGYAPSSGLARASVALSATAPARRAVSDEGGRKRAWGRSNFKGCTGHSQRSQLLVHPGLCPSQDIRVHILFRDNLNNGSGTGFTKMAVPSTSQGSA